MCEGLVSVPNFMCKMYETDIFEAFYFRKTIILTNIAELKLSQISIK